MADREGGNQMVMHLSQARRRRRSSRRRSQRLPDDILHKIFSFLPIKHAVQTTALARRFDQSWMHGQKLDFGEDFARGRSRHELLMIIHRVFALHLGPKIQSFQLYVDHTYMEWMIQPWIIACLQKEVEELDLDFARATPEPFALHNNLLDSESIRILKLTNCRLHVPPELRGLGLLNTLILKMVNVTEQLIRELFKNCLFIETMSLIRCHGIIHLRIFAGNLKRFKWLRVDQCPKMVKVHVDSPTLRSMYYSGDIEVFTMANMLRLKDATVMINQGGFFPFVGIEKFMFAISHVQVFTTTSKFIKGLSPNVVNGDVQEALLFCFWNLRELELYMNGVICGPFSIVNFINKCPFLEKVTINLEGHYFYMGFYWEAHDGQTLEVLDITFKSLKSVRINGFQLEGPVMKFVNFILERAGSLETLELDTTDSLGSPIDLARLAAYDQLQMIYDEYPGVQITIY